MRTNRELSEKEEPTGEAVRQVSQYHIEIDKPPASVVVQCNVALAIKPSKQGRVFNMAPGAEAVPIISELTPQQTGMVPCEISVGTRSK